MQIEKDKRDVESTDEEYRIKERRVKKDPEKEILENGKDGKEMVDNSEDDRGKTKKDECERRMISNKKREKRTPFKIEEKERVIDIYRAICDKYPNYSAVKQHKLTSQETGIHLSSVYRIITEYTTTGLKEPKANKKRKLLIDTLDEFTKNAIRKKVHALFLKNKVSTVDRILQAIQQDEQLPNFKRTTLYALLKALHFKYENGRWST